MNKTDQTTETYAMLRRWSTQYSGMRIAVGGSAANPVTNAHVQLLEAICDCGLFDLVTWIPSGDRPDKPNLVSGEHRFRMTKLAFPREWQANRTCRLIINPMDVLRPPNTPTIDWIKYYRFVYPGAEVVWYTGVDTVVPIYDGKSEIEARWVSGYDLWNRYPFIIVPREGYAHPQSLTLPEQFQILNVSIHDISSTEVKARIIAGESFEDLVPDGVAQYIKEYQLYGYDSNRRKIA